MRVVILYNPSSGKGRSKQVSEFVARALEHQGWNPLRVASIAGSGERFLTALDGAKATVIVGGDGTMHHAAPILMQAQVPFTVLPLGTENLLAREFAMTRSVERVVRTLRARRVVMMDTASANGRTFLVMASSGPDASVIHRMASIRSGSISHLSYLRPMISEACRPAICQLSITVDGRPIVDDQFGMVVVANSRQYAMRVDPAPRASVTDGLLDLVFFPARTTAGVVGWMVQSRLRRADASLRIVRTRGAEILIRASGRGAPVQLDGEASDLRLPLHISVAPKSLAVLVNA